MEPQIIALRASKFNAGELPRRLRVTGGTVYACAPIPRPPAKEFPLPATVENLKIAFAGESQANRKYLAFARRAEKDGLPQIAKLFRAAAEAETIHALSHLQNMGGVGSTIENLQSAVAGETYEYSEMYPPMVEQARSENNKAKTMLDYANQAERVHADLYRQALAALQAGKDLDAMDVYLCPVCGHLEFGKPPEKCPICGLPAAKYQKVA
jgi:rubrerythrin